MKKKQSIGYQRTLNSIQKRFPAVTNIIDAKEGIEIEVTRKDVAKSKRYDHTHCAVAEACKRMKSVDGALVSMSRAYLIHGTTATRYEVGVAVARELTSFDRSGSFVPGQYALGPVDKSHKFGAANNSKDNYTGARPRRKQHATMGVRARL